MVVYFAGYADEQNNIILTNGDRVNMFSELVDYLKNYKNHHLFLFQDCMTEYSNYGDIFC